MIEKVVITAMIVFAVWYSMQEDEIFGGLRKLFEKLPEALHKPVFDCPVCMGFWYSLPLFYFLWQIEIGYSFIFSIAVVGLNAVITKLWPDD